MILRTGRERHPTPRFGPMALRPYASRPGDAPRRPTTGSAREVAAESADDPERRSVELGVLEAALFLADGPLGIRRLTEAAGLKDATETHRLLAQLRERLKSTRSPFGIEEIAGGFQFLTAPHFQPWLARLRRPGHIARLTPALMETLTVLAYKQPLTRAALDGVRGVDCGEALRALVERGLVRTAGREESLGRPQLYGTSKLFLQVFGFDSAGGLPTLED